VEPTVYEKNFNAKKCIPKMQVYYIIQDDLNGVEYPNQYVQLRQNELLQLFRARIKASNLSLLAGFCACIFEIEHIAINGKVTHESFERQLGTPSAPYKVHVPPLTQLCMLKQSLDLSKLILKVFLQKVFGNIVALENSCSKFRSCIALFHAKKLYDLVHLDINPMMHDGFNGEVVRFDRLSAGRACSSCPA